MEVVIVADEVAAGEVVADVIADRLAAGPAVLGLATGSSPLGAYRALIARHRRGEVSFSGARAVLLDKDDPSKVIGRTSQPILAAKDQDREGYVPNVVYSCGALKHGDTIFMPYGIADSSVGFAFVPIKDMLAAMK